MTPLAQAIVWTVTNSIAVGLAVALTVIYILDWSHRAVGDPPSVERTRRTHLWDQVERIAVRLFMLSLGIFAIITSASDVYVPPEVTWPMITIRLGFTLVCLVMAAGDVRRLRERSIWEEEVWKASNELPKNTTALPTIAGEPSEAS